jgi:hypothetical protein
MLLVETVYLNQKSIYLSRELNNELNKNLIAIGFISQH